MNWTGSILADDEIDNILKAATISSPSMGDAPQTVSQGEGTLAGGVAPPNQNQAEEEEEKKKLVDAVTQRLKKSMPQNGWFQSMFGKDAETMVKELRNTRRIRKDMREDIDLAT